MYGVVELKAKRTYWLIVFNIKEKQKQAVAEKLAEQLKATRIAKKRKTIILCLGGKKVI